MANRSIEELEKCAKIFVGVFVALIGAGIAGVIKHKRDNDDSEDEQSTTRKKKK